MKRWQLTDARARFGGLAALLEGSMLRRIRPYTFNPDDPNDRERFHARLRESNLPERYWRSTLEAVQDPGTLSQVRQLLETWPATLADGQGYHIAGPFNAGKSSIAAILLMDAVRRSEKALWLPVRDVPGVRFREDDLKRALDNRLGQCDLLVLDDLGAERFKLSGAAGTALEEVARTVYDRGRSLIVTSNLSWRQTEEQYGAEQAAFMSVLKRMVTPLVVENRQWPGN